MACGERRKCAEAGRSQTLSLGCNKYVSVLAHYKPDCVPELLAYITMIIRASQGYSGLAWVCGIMEAGGTYWKYSLVHCECNTLHNIVSPHNPCRRGYGGICGRCSLFNCKADMAHLMGRVLVGLCSGLRVGLG